MSVSKRASRTASVVALENLESEIIACRRCPRLVSWREEVAETKRAAFRDQDYWGRPVPGFGDPEAWLLVVGLAPAAHGANRTGRMFTGDRSGDWLYRALDRAGLANQPDSTGREDGLVLRGAYITAAVRCAPPGNRPTPAERDACRPFLEQELDSLHGVCVIVALGGFAWANVMRVLRDRRARLPRPAPSFGHAAEVPIGEVSATAGALEGASQPLWLLGSYHPSQQNTFTGRLTEEMFDSIWHRARELQSKPVGG